jgi:copper(I)-binding protein
MFRRTLLLAALVIAAPVSAFAQTAISVTDAWSRPAIAGHVGVAYLTASITTGEDLLKGASSPIAPIVELHESRMENNMMTMRPVASVPVTPHVPAVLAPGGYHLMLIGLTKALQPGDRFPLTLHFQQAGDVTVTVTVRGGDAAHHAMPGMKMD